MRTKRVFLSSNRSPLHNKRTKSGRARPEFLQCTQQMCVSRLITTNTRATTAVNLLWTTSTTTSSPGQTRIGTAATSPSRSSSAAWSSSPPPSRLTPSSAADYQRCEVASLTTGSVLSLRRHLDALSRNCPSRH